MSSDDVLLVSEWEDLTVAQLKEELIGRGLETTGRKSDLVARLEANDREILNAQNQEEEAAAEENKEEENGDDDLVVWADDEAVPEEDQLVLDDDDDNDDGDKQVADDKIDEMKAKESSETAAQEFHIEISKDKELLNVTWHGHKLDIPMKEEVNKDIKRFMKQQNIIIYPAELCDVYSEELRPLVEQAMNVSMELDETIPGKPIKGYLRLKFGSASLAAHAMDILKEYKPGDREITLELFGEKDSEGHILSKVKGKDSEHRDPLLHRLMFVSNLPNDTTEETLMMLFQDAVRVYISTKEEATDRHGHAYVEYPSEAEAIEAVARHTNAEIGGQKLYIIKSLTVHKNKFGFNREELRRYWLEQIRQCESAKAKPQNKSVKDLQDIDKKLLTLKKRINKDNKIRQNLGMPIPENELFQVPEGDSDKEEQEESTDRKHSSSSTRRDTRVTERRSPPHRRRYSPNRSYHHSGRGSGSFRGGPPGRADILVNQLQEIVGVLSDIGGSRGGGRGGYYGGGRGGGGYGGGPSYGRDYTVSSSRYSGKRPAEFDYDIDRKRRMDDYPGYGGGRSNYGSYGGSQRGGSGYNY